MGKKNILTMKINNFYIIFKVGSEYICMTSREYGFFQTKKYESNMATPRGPTKNDFLQFTSVSEKTMVSQCMILYLFVVNIEILDMESCTMELRRKIACVRHHQLRTDVGGDLRWPPMMNTRWRGTASNSCVSGSLDIRWSG